MPWPLVRLLIRLLVLVLVGALAYLLHDVVARTAILLFGMAIALVLPILGKESIV